jgi:hypothetical protein
MEYEIEPYVGVGPIRLGMTKEEIHTIILEERELTKKGGDIPADYFPTLGLFVHYRAPGVCAFVEMFGPPISPYSAFQDSTFFPSFQGKTFLGRPYRQVRGWFKRRDPDITEGISRRFGIAIYDGIVGGRLNRVESVSIFEKGYYEEIWHLIEEMDN